MKKKIHPFVWIALAAMLVWGVTLSFDFVWDDFPMIADNSSLHRWGSLFSGWIHDFWMLHDSPQVSGYWRPIPTMVHVLVTKLTGGAPWIFHFLNVTLHTFTAYFFYRFLINTGWFRWVWVPVLFFLCHPIVAETVSFNSAIPDLLCAVFGWAAVSVWTDQNQSHHRTTKAILFLALCILSKESGVFFGLFLIGYDFLSKSEKPNPKKLNFHGVIFAMIVLYVAFHLLVIHGLGARSMWGNGLVQHFATVCKLFGYQFLLVLLPVGSSPTRDFSIGTLSDPFSWTGLVLLLWLIGMFLYLRARKSVWAFAIFFYLVFWFPISNIIPAEGLIADRYMYVTSMAMAFALGLAFTKFNSFPKIIAVVLIGWGAWAVHNSLVWKNSEKLWGHAILVSPKSSVAWNEWGNVLTSQQKLSEAYQAYDQAVKLQPQYRDASFNRVVTVFLMKDTLAKNNVQTHLKIFPEDAQAFDLMGSIYENENEYALAVLNSLRAVELAPNQWKYRYNLAEVYLRMRNYEDAILQLKMAFDLVQDRFEIEKNLAVSYCLNAQYKECLETYEDFCRRFPEKSADVKVPMEQARQLLQLTQEH